MFTLSLVQGFYMSKVFLPVSVCRIPFISMRTLWSRRRRIRTDFFWILIAVFRFYFGIKQNWVRCQINYKKKCIITIKIQFNATWINKFYQILSKFIQHGVEFVGILAGRNCFYWALWSCPAWIVIAGFRFILPSNRIPLGTKSITKNV